MLSWHLKMPEDLEEVRKLGSSTESFTTHVHTPGKGTVSGCA